VNIDDDQLVELITESQDLQADALRGVHAAAADLRDIGRERQGRPVDPDEVRAFNTSRRQVIANGGLGLGALAGRGLLATGFGTALAAIVARPANAAADVDVQILQTAASLENLAVATYGAALALPGFDANPVVKTFAQTTKEQHTEHGKAFNSLAENLGGKAQDEPNPDYKATVDAALPTLVSDGKADYTAIVALAATLEEVASDTYLENLSLLDDTPAKKLMGSVMGVEVQHLATLRAVGALLAGNAAQLIAIPTDVAALPAAAGSVAFPEAVPDGDKAADPDSGAVQ
jgi:rubrerythrin